VFNNDQNKINLDILLADAVAVRNLKNSLNYSKLSLQVMCDESLINLEEFVEFKSLGSTNDHKWLEEETKIFSELYTQKFLYFNKLYKNESLLKKDFF
jgi:hypothetical protein